MKVLLNRTLALGAVLALIGFAGTSATAQSWGNYRRSGYTGNQIRRDRHEIEVLQRLYDHEMRSGHRQAAIRAHMRAERIRERLRRERAHDRWDRW